jgi:hypothetical protein
LRWRAPASCPSEAEMRAQIARLLGRTPPSGPRRVAVRGNASQRRGRWRMSVRTETGGEIGERSIDAPSCAELADAFVLIAALAIDPQAAAGPVEAPINPAEAAAGGSETAKGRPGAAAGGSETVAGPANAAAGRAGPATGRTDAAAGGVRTTPAPLAGWAGAGLRTSLGPLPELGVGIRVHAALRRARMRFELGASYWFEQDATIAAGPPAAGGSIRFFNVGSRFCHDVIGQDWALEGCGGVSVGQMRGDAFGVSQPGRGRSWWLALQAGPALRVPLGQHVALRGVVEAVLPFFRPAFGIDEQRPAALGAQVLVAAEARLF